MLADPFTHPTALLASFFLLVDSSGLEGVVVYSYDTPGRSVCNVRLPGLRANLLTAGAIELSDDCVAIIDQNQPSRKDSCKGALTVYVLEGFLCAESALLWHRYPHHRHSVGKASGCSSCSSGQRWSVHISRRLTTVSLSEPDRSLCCCCIQLSWTCA